MTKRHVWKSLAIFARRLLPDIIYVDLWCIEMIDPIPFYIQFREKSE